MRTTLSKFALTSTAALIMLVSSLTYGQLSISESKNVVSVSFNDDMTKDEVDYIQAQALKYFNISITFNEVKFDKQGKLLSIDFNVDCQDGYRGSASRSFRYWPWGHAGFVRDYRENSPTSFSVGSQFFNAKRDVPKGP